MKFRQSYEVVNDRIELLVATSHYKKVKSFRKDFLRYFGSLNSFGIIDIMRELETLPFDDAKVDNAKAIKPDLETVHGVIRRFIDSWEV